MRLALLLLTPAACTEGSAPRENAREQTAPQVTHSTLSPAPLTHDQGGEKHEHSALDASSGPSPCELIAFSHVGIEDSPHPIVTVYAESCLRWARYEVDQVSAGSNGIPVFVALSAEALTQLHDTLGDHVVFYPQDYVEEVYGLALGTFVIAHSWPGGLAVLSIGLIVAPGCRCIAWHGSKPARQARWLRLFSREPEQNSLLALSTGSAGETASGAEIGGRPDRLK